jgi:uncharacterized membrane protein YkoI
VYRTIGRVVISAMVGLVVLAGCNSGDAKKVAPENSADERKISLDKLPEKVKAALDQRFSGAEVTNAEKETRNGQVVYDLELKHKAHRYELDVREDGIILQMYKEVADSDLPKSVIKALEEKYPKASYQEIMEVYKVEGKKEALTHYGVTLVTADKQKLEVEVSLEGKILKSDKADDDED